MEINLFLNLTLGESSLSHFIQDLWIDGWSSRGGESTSSLIRIESARRVVAHELEKMVVVIIIVTRDSRRVIQTHSLGFIWWTNLLDTMRERETERG
jgi:hypothetical protein